MLTTKAAASRHLSPKKKQLGDELSKAQRNLVF
jgi:hypothetical protein